MNTILNLIITLYDIIISLRSYSASCKCKFFKKQKITKITVIMSTYKQIYNLD